MMMHYYRFGGNPLYFNFHLAQRHSVTTVALGPCNIINATPGNSHNQNDNAVVHPRQCDNIKAIKEFPCKWLFRAPTQLHTWNCNNCTSVAQTKATTHVEAHPSPFTCYRYSSFS